MISDNLSHLQVFEFLNDNPDDLYTVKRIVTAVKRDKQEEWNPLGVYKALVDLEEIGAVYRDTRGAFCLSDTFLEG